MKRTLKLFLALLTVLLLFSSTLVGANNADPVADTEAPSSTHIIGDVTNDGLVKSLDAAMILRYDANLSSAESIGTKVPCTKAVKAFIDENLHLWVEFSDGKKINGGYAAEKPDVAGLSYVGKYAIVGDTNGDGKITALDAAMTLRYDAGLSSTDIMATKVSGNTVVDAYIDDASHCWVVLSDGGKLDAGYVGAKTYTVTFVDYDGTVLKTETVENGSAATAPAAPVREGYTFTGWDKSFDSITADTTVTATYEINKYTVSFVDYNGTVLKTETVENGKSATAPTAPTREGYTFTGWDKSFDSITADTTVTATYESAKKYTVNFVDFDGTLLKSETVDKGASVSAPADPTREGFRFIGWNGTAANVTADMTITAQYVQQFSVTFVDYNGTVLKTETVENGKSATAPTAPTRPYYTFLGWDKSFVSVTSDLVVNAMYEENTHTVTYYNTKGNAIPNQYTMYSEKDGLHLPDPETVTLTAEGYNFAGWYTKSEGGEKLDDIPVGGSVTKLYARWTAIEYTITYRDIYEKKTTTYTIEDSFEIITPYWKGLRFSHWEDTSNKLTAVSDTTNTPRLKLEKGTTGNIELIARWYAPENLIVPKESNNISLSGFDSGVYWFVYELGTIENIVLEEGVTPRDHNGSSFIIQTTETVEISEAFAKNMSESIGKSVAENTSSTMIESTTEELSASLGLKVTTGIEACVGDEEIATVSAKLESEISSTISAGASNSLQKQTAGSIETGSEEIKAFGSTYSYNATTTKATTTTYTLTADDPDGKYRFVHVGDMTVYAFIVYDPATKTLCTDIFNRMGGTNTETIYKPYTIAEEDFVNGSLAYSMDIDTIEQKIKSAYYINYDGTTADNAEDKMPISLHYPGESKALSKCTYTKEGYHLVEWCSNYDLTGTKYHPDTAITDLAEAGQTITLYAHWELNSYTVSWDNVENVKISVYRRSSSMPTATIGLISSGATVYHGDELSVLYSAYTGYTLASNGSRLITVTSDVTSESIYATVKPNTYIITYNLNLADADDLLLDSPSYRCYEDLSFAKTTYTATYGEIFTLDVPTAKYYTFDGWYNGSERVTEANGTLISQWGKASDTTLTARWVKNKPDYVYVKTTSDFESISNNTGKNYLIIANINISGIKSNGFSSCAGVIDGGGNTISGWSGCACNTSYEYFGLFRRNQGGTIKNLTIADSKICESSHDPTSWVANKIGIVCGQNNGTIENVKIKNCKIYQDHGSLGFYGNIELYVGLICGYNTGTISNCETDSSHMDIYGGVGVFQNGSTINSYDLKMYIGNIVGYTTGGVATNCTSTNCTINVTAKADYITNIWGCKAHSRPRIYVGGLIGYSNGTNYSALFTSGNSVNATVERGCSCSTNMEFYKSDGVAYSC